MAMNGRSAIVFGGARGIGRAVAAAFAERRYRLTIVARTEAQVAATVGELSSMVPVQGCTGDVSVYEDVQRAMDAHEQMFGAPEVVINTAAIQGPIGPIWDNDPDMWRTTLVANLLGSFYICRAALPLMIERDYGTLIFLSGGGAAYARPRFSAYGSSKTGVLRLVETVHEEVREERGVRSEVAAGPSEAAGEGIEEKGERTKDRGVRVYAVAPGSVKSRMTEEVLAHRGLAGVRAYEEAAETYKDGGVPPQKAAELCLFLAEERPLCLSGRLIHVNEPYREYAEQCEGKDLGASGLLRRERFAVRREAAARPGEA